MLLNELLHESRTRKCVYVVFFLFLFFLGGTWVGKWLKSLTSDNKSFNNDVGSNPDIHRKCSSCQLLFIIKILVCNVCCENVYLLKEKHCRLFELTTSYLYKTAILTKAFAIFNECKFLNRMGFFYLQFVIPVGNWN